MIATSIKLNSATFDYYILRINSNSSLQEIQSKLITLREFDKVMTDFLNRNENFILLENLKKQGFKVPS